MQISMIENYGLFEANRSYWSQRSVTYSDVNKEELSGESRHKWASVLHEAILSHFPGRTAGDISVLDIGTGPGFFAILLAERGYKVTAVDLTPEMLAEAAGNAGDLLLNFDSNWYNYLFDDAAKEKIETDRLRSAELGLGDQNIGENFDVIEDIARSLPLSALTRPVWDEAILTQLGMDIRVNRGIWKKVWTLQEQANFSSTPMFMITAFK